MKTKLILTLLFLSILSGVYAQSKTSEVTIKTKIYCDHCSECGSCEARIKNELRFTKGIQTAVLDISKQEIHVVYFNTKTSIAKIKNAINKSGFDADDQVADTKYIAQLDECCRKTEK